MRIENTVAINYRYNSKNDEKKQKVIETFVGSDYGVTVTYNEINQILGLDLDNEDTYYENMKYLKRFVSKLKNYLIKKGIVIKSVKDVGWYILKPEHISSYTYRQYMVKPMKSYQKAQEILNHFDKTKLNEDRKEEYENIDYLNKKLLKDTDTIICSSRYYKNKAYYDNLDK